MSGRCVTGKPGPPACDTVLAHQPSSPLVPHVLSGSGSSYLTQQKQCSWLFGSEASENGHFDFLAPVTVSHERKYIEAFAGWALDWLLDSRIPEQHGRKALTSRLSLAWIFFSTFHVFTPIPTLLALYPREILSILTFELGTLAS